MTYAVVYTPKARRALHERLPEPVAAACVEFIGSVLAVTPYRVGKSLRAPLEGLLVARRGEFRVVYRVDEAQVTVLVVTIDHRRDVYRG